jgi:hypothetical protein
VTISRVLYIWNIRFLEPQNTEPQFLRKGRFLRYWSKKSVFTGLSWYAIRVNLKLFALVYLKNPEFLEGCQKFRRLLGGNSILGSRLI